MKGNVKMGNGHSRKGKNELSKIKRVIPYGHQTIEEEDIRAVCEVLKSEMLTTGPKVEEFEEAFSKYINSVYSVSVSSGTAALHSAMFALKVGQGDEVIVPPMTFVATVNSILYMGGIPVFADVDPNTLLIDPYQIEKKITKKTKGIIGVDYAGQPCEWDVLRKIADGYNLFLLDDACHALGAKFKGSTIGTLADLTVFSFHPVKHITTGEGGMIVTENEKIYNLLKIFRNHGIDKDHAKRELNNSWFYEMHYLGYNYRISDFQCALGISQLKRLPEWVVARNKIAWIYEEGLKGIPGLTPISLRDDLYDAEYIYKNKINIFYENVKLQQSIHAYHLYVIKINSDLCKIDRNKLYFELKKAKIGVNVHYIPVHLHPYYKEKLGTGLGLCPVAEKAYDEIISLPIYPGLGRDEQEYIINKIREILL